jgi:hypothetical protein
VFEADPNEPAPPTPEISAGEVCDDPVEDAEESALCARKKCEQQRITSKAIHNGRKAIHTGRKLKRYERNRREALIMTTLR